MKSKIMLSFLIIASSFFGIFTGFETPAKANTTDSPSTFSFFWNDYYDYTNARRKDNTSYMYMRVTNTTDSNRNSFTAQPQVDSYYGTGTDWVNTGNGGTVYVGKKYAFTNYAVEDYGTNVQVRFRGYRASASALSIDVQWSPDYVTESGVIIY